MSQLAASVEDVIQLIYMSSWLRELEKTLLAHSSYIEPGRWVR